MGSEPPQGPWSQLDPIIDPLPASGSPAPSMLRRFSLVDNSQQKWKPRLRSLSTARSTDSLDRTGDGPLRPLGNTAASVKGKAPKRLSITRAHFPKLADCAHFHYEAVDFGHIQLLLASEQGEGLPSTLGDRELLFIVQVTCRGKTWPVHRSYEEFCRLDGHLHCCIFDRRFSQLPELPPPCQARGQAEMLAPVLRQYLEKLSAIVDSNINCGPVLTWMEIDNHGNRLLVNEEASINVPAIAAAHVIKRYTAQAPDELSFEVGDIVSVIDMPPKEEVSWWRGKHGFQVGFFPSECVELFPDRLAPELKADTDGTGASIPGVLTPQGPLSPTLVCKKHGKLLGFLRTFMKSRPSKQRLKQRGILRERVFGCDLGEHLLNSGHDVPQVLRCCSEFIEKHGMVDGIYRLSGVASNIQKLRHEFDSERVPELGRATYLQDIHCVSSLCKLYFRELPNPLLTYQLYHKFAEAVAVPGEEERLVRVHDVIQQLPPPHYRTLEFLLRHLARVATHSPETSMHVKNLAIVWAPNLLRSLELEAVGLSGAEAFHEVRVQSVVVEFLLNHVQVLFSDKFTSIGKDSAGRSYLPRPKSLLGSCPSTRLLSLEEAQARTQAQAQHTAPGQAKRPEAETRRGPPGRLPLMLDSPHDRCQARGGSWKTFFALGRAPAISHKRVQRPGGQTGLRADTVTLRSAKSEESLTSQSSTAGLHKLNRLRRPRSSSDAFPALPGALPGSLPAPLKPCRSCESLSSSASGGYSESLAPHCRTSLWLDDEGELDSDPELSPPGFLDLDVLPFRRSSHRRPSLSEASDSAPSPTRLPFTCKVTRALSSRGPEPPTAALEISEPVAISLPAKVLEMLGGGEAGGVLRPGRHWGTRSPPHMISRLLQAGDGMLTDSCQREVQHKLTQAESGSLAQSPESEASPPLPGALCLFRHVPPPPPPKNPARLMALALAESAHRAARQQQGAPRREQRAQFRRSLSLEGGGEGAAMGPGTLYSVVRPGPAAQLPDPSLQRQQSQGEPRGQRQERAGGPQVTLAKAPAPGGEGGRASLAAPPHYSKAPPDTHHWGPEPHLPCQTQPLPFPRALDPAPRHPQAPPKPPAPLHFHPPPAACLNATPQWLDPPCTAPPYPPEPQLHQRHHFLAPRPPGAATHPQRPLLEPAAENLYYEIVPEPPVYRPWPLGPPRLPAPRKYMATLNASYGVFQQPRPNPLAPTPPFWAIFEDGRVRYEPPEPIYVNVPFAGPPAGPEARGHRRSRATPPSSSSSASASPPPEGGHLRSRSEPGAARAALHRPPVPALPQKQRQGLRAAPGWAYGPPSVPGLYRQLLDVLPCGGTMLRFYRPAPPGWEPATGCTPPFTTYAEPSPRPPALLSPSLLDGYRLGPYSPYAERLPPQYGNVEKKEGPPPPPACLAPNWTVHSEGQTRSYC
ncbi:rho GTPase-activating protein 33 isoform X2 [Malaclemys terrapin pileata]|uniref:rho GTPase-activating protein 33 isoform X2 n=1 Tax=Malaclemys terrapin pileata TaxID=2991368 RepID=UPI0023A7E40F|nr:rho GTPase-activating protein 33 isoform X2 [Malaclemys terrapin pileata]